MDELDIKNEDLSSIEKTEKQHGNNTDHLKPYQWKKGQSGNEKGRPKGKSLKEFARQYLEALSEEDKVEFIKHIPMDTIWKMAEGNPKQDTELSGKDGQPIIIQVAQELLNKNNINNQDGSISDTSTSTDSSGLPQV